LHIVDSDLVSSITTVDWFAHFIGDKPVFPRAACVSTVPPSNSVTSGWDGKYSTHLMQELLAASALWNTVAEGGSYVPGDVRTAPNVAAFLRARGVASQKLSAAMATILRDPNLPKGRPPKS